MEAQFSEIDLKLTQRALELASQGIGQVSPSPLVGCVITDSSGEVVGEGTYIYEKITHAEILALEQAGLRAINGTAYISLEPHNHYGRTPPCTEALIRAKIKRVVCPIKDPNPLVSGTGFEHLRRAGIEVVTGLLAAEAARLNEKFVHWHQRQRPFVHLKMAMSLDGRIATRTGDSRWITNESSLQRVHELRHEYDAILIGSNTALIDNPVLTDRSEKKRRRPLVRVILDNNLRLSPASKLAQTAADIPTIVFTDNQNSEKSSILAALGMDIIQIAEGGRNLIGVLNELKKRDVQSVLVEGGASIAGAFFDAKLIDKVSFFYAPIIIGGEKAFVAIGGNGAQRLTGALKLSDLTITTHDNNFEVTGYPKLSNEA